MPAPDLHHTAAHVATMLAEASQALTERDYHALRSYAGAAPITRQSGKKKVVVMRRSCNERLRNVLYHWSRVSAQNDERSKAHYAALRGKGYTHGRALRGLGDRLMAVLIAMLESGTRPAAVSIGSRPIASRFWRTDGMLHTTTSNTAVLTLSGKLEPRERKAPRFSV